MNVFFIDCAVLLAAFLAGGYKAFKTREKSDLNDHHEAARKTEEKIGFNGHEALDDRWPVSRT